MENLKPVRFDPQVLDWAQEQIFNAKSIKTAILAQLFVTRHLKDKMRIIQKRVFPPPRLIAKKYRLSLNSKRLFLYYPVHLKDSVLMYGRAAWRLLTHDEELVNLGKSFDRWEKNRRALRHWLALGQ